MLAFVALTQPAGSYRSFVFCRWLPLLRLYRAKFEAYFMRKSNANSSFNRSRLMPGY